MSESLSNPQTLSTKERIATWFLPNVGDIIFLLMLTLPLWLRPSFVFGDGSTGWHLVAGQYILEQHRVPTVDLISYTYPQKHWFCYEWLSDLLMAGLVKLGGDLNLLAVFVSCAIALLMLLLYQRCRKEGANFVLSLVLIVIGSIPSSIHWLARPHIFNFFGVYFLTTWLEDFWRAEMSAKKLLILAPLVALLWVNLHPAFLLGLALIAAYLFSAVLLMVLCLGTTSFAEHARRAKALAIVFVCSVAVTLINPFGYHLYEHLIYVIKGQPYFVSATNEFMSPVFHGALQPACLEILFAFFIIGLALGKPRLSLPRLLCCLAFSHLALSAVRNMPLFVVVVLPAIAQLLSRLSVTEAKIAEMGSHKAWWSPLMDKWRELSTGFDQNESLCNKHMTAAVAFFLLSCAALNHGQLMGSQWLSSGWGESDKPTATLEYLRQAEGTGKLSFKRGFNYDNWGGYLRYVLGTRVFIDDRAEFYAFPLYPRYVTVILAQPGWKALLDGAIYDGTEQQGSSVQWILMPKNHALVALLKDDPDWGPAVKQDQASALFVRKGDR